MKRILLFLSFIIPNCWYNKGELSTSRMILITHAIAGAALAATQKNPLMALITGFLSHFVLDIVPHWEYRIDALQKDPLSREAIPSYRKIAIDGLLGAAVPVAVFVLWNGANFWLIFSGLVGGLLPDALQGAHLFFPKNKPLAALYRFHHSIQQATAKLRPYPAVGITFTVAATLLFIALGLSMR